MNNELKIFNTILLLIFTLNLNADHLHGGEINYKIIDTTNGIYQISLFLDRPCTKSQLANSFNYNIKFQNEPQITSTFKYYQSIYIPSACFGSDPCIIPNNTNIERKEYRDTVILGKNKGYVTLWYKGYNRAYSGTINSSESPLFLTLTLNTNYFNSCATYSPFQSYFPMSTEPISESWQKFDLENDSTNLSICASYIDTTSSIFNPLKAVLNPGLTDSKPLFINESSLQYSKNKLKYTPSQAQDGWINTIVKEYRKLTINNKDTLVLLSQYNKDRHISINDYSSDIILQSIESPNNNIHFNNSNITICNNLDSNILLFKFKKLKTITTFEEKIEGISYLENSNSTKTIVSSSTSLFDTLVYRYKFKVSTRDTSISLVFNFNYCKNNQTSLTHQSTINLKIFNYKYFQKDSLLSCNTSASIDLINSKSALFSYGTRNGQSLDILNPVDTFIYSFVTHIDTLCPIKDSIYLNQGSVFSTQTTIKNITCFEYQDGTAKISATGSNGPFSYKWQNNSTLDSIVGLKKGTYTVSTYDKDQCIKKDTFTILEPIGIKAIWSTTQPISCFRDSNGAGNFNINGALRPLSYHWNHTTSQDSFLTNLKAGYYSGFYTYNNLLGNSCTQNFNLNIIQPDSLIINTIKIDNKCFGDSNGQIAISAIGANSYYRYYLDTVGNYYSLKSKLASGIYTIKVKDLKGCSSVTKSVEIYSPQKIKVDINSLNPSCIESKNGKMTLLNLRGGVQPFIFKLNNEVSTLNSVFNNLDTGYYKIKTTDINECSIDTSIVLKANYKINADITNSTDVKCYGDSTGKISIKVKNAFNPLTININTISNIKNIDSFTIDNLHYGYQSIKIKDSNKCFWDTTVLLNQPNPFVLSKKITNPICYESENGKIEVTITGNNPPYSNYKWNQIPSTTSTIQNIRGGMYILYLEDKNKCSIEDTINVPFGPKLDIKLAIEKEITCDSYTDGIINSTIINAIEPIEYQWNQYPFSSLAKFTQAHSGLNFVKVKDKNGCIAENSISLNSPPILSIEDIKIKNSDCPNSNNGQIQIYVKGGNYSSTNPYLYSINNGQSFISNNIFNNLKPEKYQLIIKDQKECFIKKEQTISIENELHISFMDSILFLKSGESMDLNPQITYGLNTNYSSISKINWTPVNGLSCSNCINPKAMPFNTTSYLLDISYGMNCNTKSALKLILDKPNEIYIPNTFSPNGDNINDEWSSYSNYISSYDCQIFDKLGQLVFRSNDIKKPWNGTYKSKECPVDLYSYKIIVTYIDGTNQSYYGSINLLK